MQNEGLLWDSLVGIKEPLSLNKALTCNYGGDNNLSHPLACNHPGGDWHPGCLKRNNPPDLR